MPGFLKRLLCRLRRQERKENVGAPHTPAKDGVLCTPAFPPKDAEPLLYALLAVAFNFVALVRERPKLLRQSRLMLVIIRAASG